MFDPKKPVQTRNGRKARVLCSDLNFPSGKTIAAAVEGQGTYCGKPTETLSLYHTDGHYLDVREDNLQDLVNVPERRYKYENVYVSTDGKFPSRGGWLDSRERVDNVNQLNKKRVGVLKFTLEDNVVVSVELENA